MSLDLPSSPSDMHSPRSRSQSPTQDLDFSDSDLGFSPVPVPQHTSYTLHYGPSSSTTAGKTTEANPVMSIHRGAIDHTTITTRPPSEVMDKVRDILDSIGVCVQPESSFRFRCIRPASGMCMESPQPSDMNTTDLGSWLDGPDPVQRSTSTTHSDSEPASTLANTIYSSNPSRDPAGEVRFSVELTRLAGLHDTYSLDIRRLKGNLRSYQFIYETIRDRAQLTT